MKKHPIILFAYFSYNYPPGFIKTVWADWGENFINHLESKFSGYYKTYGSRGVMLRFFVELSTDHQTRLSEWIVTNYKG